MEGEEEYVIAQPAPSSTVERFVRKVIQFANRFMENESAYPKRIHYGDGYFLTSEETSSILDQLVSEICGRVYDGEKLHMGKIMKWAIDEDDEFILIVKCEELAAGGNGGEKFKWTYYVCIDK
jgi:hypothetical protein